MLNKAILSVLAVSTLTVFACGGDDPPASTESTGSGSVCIDYSSVSGDASFKLDVMPLFDQACNSMSCHGGSSPAQGLGLTAATDDERTALINTLTSTTASQATLKLVEPGDPAASFLLIKCEYDKAGIEACTESCGGTGCGSPMPFGTPLAESEKEVLRRWIASGAQDN